MAGQYNGCGKEIEVGVPTKYSYKMIKMHCGNTGIDGYPVFCEECEVVNAGRDFRREAIEAGENFDDDY